MWLEPVMCCPETTIWLPQFTGIDGLREKRRSSTCVGCGAAITDQYILRVSPDLEWHAACLKCADCHQYLDETCTCFVRDGRPTARETTSGCLASSAPGAM
ncbi:insulin gene enhancer protein isl-2a [Caerostris extrusa]|uniref:Insulin gene enhancer protein isl-2a n=1 Tax=Caerostris extrusa TaxID=172846 RepID=A0AAV4Y8T1_CAEEX|nr:insulin gene enhancer protein isl-2a [Caerostris extrusa]